MGGLVGGRLALAGHALSIVDVGAHLEAIRRRGLQLWLDDGQQCLVRPVAAVDDCREAGQQDLVILSVKAQVLPALAEAIATMIGPETIVLPLQNGIPWWYFHRHGGPHEGRRIAAIDPDGTLETHLPSHAIIGCVAYPAGEIVMPGVVRHVEGRRLTIGELDGADTPRIRALAAHLNDAGFKTYAIPDIRSEIWLKLLGNVSLNHICALTRATMAEACQHGPTRRLAHAMMREAEAIARRLGVTLRLPIEKRIEGAERVGHHRPSTLQDVEAGRAMELSPMITAVLELRELVGVRTPFTETVYALVSLLDRTVQMNQAVERLHGAAATGSMVDRGPHSAAGSAVY